MRTLRNKSIPADGVDFVNAHVKKLPPSTIQSIPLRWKRYVKTATENAIFLSAIFELLKNMSTPFHGFQFSRTWCNSQEMGWYKSDTMEYFCQQLCLATCNLFCFSNKHGTWVSWRVSVSRTKMKIPRLDDLLQWDTVYMPNNNASFIHAVPCSFPRSHKENREKWFHWRIHSNLGESSQCMKWKNYKRWSYISFKTPPPPRGWIAECFRARNLGSYTHSHDLANPTEVAWPVSTPSSPYIREDNKCSSVTGFFEGLNVKHFKKCPAQSKCYINIIITVLIVLLPIIVEKAPEAYFSHCW